MKKKLTRALALRLTAILGALGVILGAFGAHGLEETLIANGHLEHWKTATMYHLIHAVALLGLCALPRFGAVAWSLMFGGVLFFSGSLYVLSLADQTWLGAVAPVGGTLLIAGWLVAAWQGNRLCSRDTDD